MNPRRLGLALAFVSAIFGPVAAADHPVEIVPMIGIRGGATLDSDSPGRVPAEASPAISYGLAVDVDLRPDAWLELFIERQTLSFTADPAVFGVDRFDLTIDSLGLGGAYGPRRETVRPFVSAALGLTHYGADTGTVDSTMGLSGSIGGGFKTPMGKRLEFKFEVLGYATAGDTALSVTCGPGCSVRFAASGWYQLAARAGLAIRL